MSDVTLRESTEQKEGAFGTETSAPQLNDLGDKSLRGIHNTDPVGQVVHPHAAEVAIGIEPRRHGPKHLAPVLPEPLKAGGKGSARVKGPSGSLASINGEANTFEAPNHSIQGTLPNGGGRNHNDIIKVGEHAAGRGESDQAALDVLEGGGETDSKQGRRQRATLVNAPRE